MHDNEKLVMLSLFHNTSVFMATSSYCAILITSVQHSVNPLMPERNSIHCHFSFWALVAFAASVNAESAMLEVLNELKDVSGLIIVKGPF